MRLSSLFISPSDERRTDDRPNRPNNHASHVPFDMRIVSMLDGRDPAAETRGKQEDEEGEETIHDLGACLRMIAWMSLARSSVWGFHSMRLRISPCACSTQSFVL